MAMFLESDLPIFLSDSQKLEWTGRKYPTNEKWVGGVGIGNVKRDAQPGTTIAV
jgi:hypothetical protein